jgi:putative ABC transport system ATP-binding protein
MSDKVLENGALQSQTMPAVTVAGVSHVYGTGPASKTVLTDINLSLRQGEFVVLTGPSGAGKTTLLTLIGALRSLQTGSIRIADTEIAGISPEDQRAFRRKTGFIFQGHNLFEALTAFDTLWLATELRETRPTHDEALAEASELLGALGMAEYLNSRPGTLSTGQKQRIAVARALINNPPLILADEPTASLDQVSSHMVIDLIRARVRNGATALMITHDSRIFPDADRVVQMMDGRIAEAA